MKRIPTFSITFRGAGRAGLSARHPILVLLGIMLLGISAPSQSSDIPGDSDYAAFSRFITQRNIFDPNRYPHETRTYHRTYTHHTSSSAPSFALVGIMSYAKGNFAFFSGNSDDLKKILPVSGTIAGYTIKEITVSGAVLQGPDKKTLQLNIGDQLREENNGWQPAGPAEISTSSSTESSGASGTSSDSSTVAPSASLGSSDILKRLMQLREQENK